MRAVEAGSRGDGRWSLRCKPCSGKTVMALGGLAEAEWVPGVERWARRAARALFCLRRLLCEIFLWASVCL